MIQLLQGDALSVLATLAPGSIQTVITSPPYYGLRKYSDDPREIGQEAAPDCLAWARREPPCGACYVCALRAVFAAVWRVLRSDGTAWVNLGDSHGSGDWGANRGERANRRIVPGERVNLNTGIAAKNLLLIPARVALALQSDGWIVRSDVIWSKPNCMPESVTDRPTRAHEYVYLLSKQARYYYDAEAIAEPVSNGTHGGAWNKGGAKYDFKPTIGGEKSRLGNSPDSGTRNKRSVWTIADPESERDAFGLYLANMAQRLMAAGVDSATIGAAMRQAEADNLAAYAEKSSVWQISTRPFSGAHFATMPEALIEPCLLAGSSAQACETCGAAWGRVVERETTGVYEARPDRGLPAGMMPQKSRAGDSTSTTLGFAPRCACPANTGAAFSTVLDCFAGTFTVGRVAERFGRNAIGIELNPDYSELSDARTNGVQKELFV